MSTKLLFSLIKPIYFISYKLAIALIPYYADHKIYFAHEVSKYSLNKTLKKLDHYAFHHKNTRIANRYFSLYAYDIESLHNSQMQGHRISTQPMIYRLAHSA